MFNRNFVPRYGRSTRPTRVPQAVDNGPAPEFAPAIGDVVSYKGRNYRAISEQVNTRFGWKVELEFLNGSKSFYADAALVGEALTAEQVEASKPARPVVKVRIVRGRPKTKAGDKVALGTEGERFWRGEDSYRAGEYRIGIRLADGSTLYTAERNVEYVREGEPTGVQADAPLGSNADVLNETLLSSADPAVEVGTIEGDFSAAFDGVVFKMADPFVSYDQMTQEQRDAIDRQEDAKELRKAQMEGFATVAEAVEAEQRAAEVVTGEERESALDFLRKKGFSI